MWICEIREYDEQNAEQAELKLCPNPKTTMIKYFQVFLKKPKKTYNTRMFESNWEYVTTMPILYVPIRLVNYQHSQRFGCNFAREINS